MPRNIGTPLLAAALLALTAVPSTAVTPQTWRTTGVDGWAATERESTGVTSDGLLGLGLGAVPVTGLDAFVVWDLLKEGKDLLVATGDDGVLYRVTPGGPVTEAARVSEPEITALGRDGRGRVLLGTAPDGILYRLDADGAVPVVEVPESYVWAILPEGRSGAFLATGNGGKVFRLTSDDRLEVLADLGVTHVTALVPYDGGLLATTDSPGQLLHLDARGNVRVLYEADEGELRAPVVLADGSVYFLANPDEGAGRVYRLGKNGSVEPIWIAPANSFVYALAADGEASLWVGTGLESGSGSLVNLTPGPPATWMEAITLDEPQVLALLMDNEAGTRWIGTGGGGRVYRVLREGAAWGTATSTVRDAGGESRWGALTVEPGPPGRGVTIETRSGNKRIPDESWSEWERVQLADGRGQIPSPRARFLQWRIQLEHSKTRVGGIRVVYLPANLSPRITAATVSPLGETLKQSTDRGQPSSMFQELPGGVRVEFQTNNSRSNAPEAAGDDHAAWARRYRTITWEASDPNDDAMRFNVYLRAAGETVWKPIAEDLSSSPWVWDSATVPDGWYVVRVRASDGPDNPAGESLTAYRSTDSFLVDNTPPAVTGLRVSRATLTGVAEDSSSPIKKLELAVDGKPWTRMFPEDGIPDTSRESFQTVLEDLEAGEHVIVVRVFDLAGNPGTGRVSFTTP